MTCEIVKDFAKNAVNQLTVQSKTETISNMGASQVVWGDIATLWAIIEPLNQSERIKFDKIDSQVTHKITVRYSETFESPLTAATYRIVFKNRILEIIQAINLLEANQFVEIIAKEVQS